MNVVEIILKYLFMYIKCILTHILLLSLIFVFSLRILLHIHTENTYHNYEVKSMQHSLFLCCILCYVYVEVPV